MIATSKAQKAQEEKDSGYVAEEEEAPEFEKYLGVIVAFTSAWTFAVCSVFNRKLKEIDYSALMVYHGLIGGTLASVFILVEGLIMGGDFRFYT